MRICAFFLVTALGLNLTAMLANAQSPATQPQSQPQAAAPKTNQQAVESLADRLIAAPSEEERNILLDANKDLVTVDLIRAVSTKGIQLRREGGAHAEVHKISDIALALAEREHDQRQTGICLDNVSLAFEDEGDYEQALDYGRKAIAVLEPLNDSYLANAYNNLASVFELQGDLVASLEWYTRALKLAETQGNKLRIARATFNIGNTYADLGNFRLALEQFKKSLALSEELGDELRVAYNTNSIGTVYQSQGDYDLALSYYQQSLKAREKVANKSEIADTLINIGWVYLDLGQNGLARDYLEKALKLKQEAGTTYGLAEVLNDYGTMLHKQGNYAEALERYQASLKVSEASGDKRIMANTLGEMAEVYRDQKDYPRSLESAQRALALAREVRSGEVIYRALDATAMALAALGRADEARSTLAESIGTIEDLRGQVAGAEEEQAHFLARNISPYQHMVELLFSRKKTEEALAFAERAKARVLLDVMRSGRVSVEKAMTPEERHEEASLLNRMTSLNARLEAALPAERAALSAELERARHDYRSFETTLYAAHPELKVARGDAQPLSVEQAASLLPDAKTALLEFVVTDEQSYLFVLSKGPAAEEPQLATYTLAVQEKDLAARVARFREQLATRDPDYGMSARALYRLLLHPAHAALAGKTALVIVPDGPLWELPFQALEPADGRHLLEQAAISYAPSLTVLAEMTRRRDDGGSEVPRLLALGDPVAPARSAENLVAMSDHTLKNATPGGSHLLGNSAKADGTRGTTDDLPSAEREVAALARLYGAEHSKVYVRATASEQVFKTEAPKYDVLHLASHGVFDNRSPMYSRLVLSEAGADDDGLLEAWEVVNLDLKARLVVLSACETARGKVSHGEGLIGMAWAFFVAGTPALVASQWKVDSASTTDLMLGFHRGLESHNESQRHSMTKARALQQAALSVMRRPQYRHPFYWAGFVLIGDGR